LGLLLLDRSFSFSLCLAAASRLFFNFSLCLATTSRLFFNFSLCLAAASRLFFNFSLCLTATASCRLGFSSSRLATATTTGSRSCGSAFVGQTFNHFNLVLDFFNLCGQLTGTLGDTIVSRFQSAQLLTQ